MIISSLRLARLRVHWNQFAKRDPLWAILTDPTKKAHRWSIDEFYRTGEEEIAKLMEYLDGCGIALARGRALDFGCGVGRVTKAMASRFDETVGIDLSPAMVELARQHVSLSGCTFIVNRYPDLRLIANDSIDLVYSKLVLQHMHPSVAARYVCDFLRVVRSNGLVVFHMPTPIQYPVTGGRLKRSIPMPMVVVYRRIKKALLYGIEFPRMEIYGMNREPLVHLVEASGGTVISVMPDQSHGDESPGFLYVVRRAS